MLILTFVSLSCDDPQELLNPFDPNVPLISPSILQIVSLTETSLTIQWSGKVTSTNASQANDSFIIVEQSLDGTLFSTLDSVGISAVNGSIKKTFTINQTYYFRIYKRVGLRTTTSSNVVSGIVTFSAPQNFIADSISETQRRLQWQWQQVSEPVAGFRIERKLGYYGTYTMLGQPSATSSTYIDTTIIKTDTIYYYRIYALTKQGTRSNYDSLTMLIPFPAPSNFTCSGNDSNKIIFQWSNTSTLPYSIIIERSVDNSDFTSIGNIASGMSTYTDNQVSKYKSYRYRLRNITKYNISAYSPVLNTNYQCSSVISLGSKSTKNYSFFIEVCRDNSTMLCQSSNDIQIIDIKSKSLLCDLSFLNSKRISRASLSGNGKILGVALQDTGVYYLYETTGGRLIQTINVPPPSVDLVISNDGKKIITSGTDNVIRVWNISDGTLLSLLTGHSSSPIALFLTFDGNTLISGSSDQFIFWDWQSGTIVKKSQGSFFTKPIFVLPDGNVYTMTYGYRTVSIINLIQNVVTASLEAPSYTSQGYLTSDGLTSVVGGGGEFLIFNLNTKTLIQRIPYGRGSIIVASSVDDSQFVTADGNSTQPYKFFQMIFSWVGS